MNRLCYLEASRASPMSSGSIPSSSSPLNSTTEFLDGLKFGQKIYFEDASVVVAQAKPSGGGGASSSSSSSGTKKGRGGGAVQQASQPPRCQVEGCKVDLSGAKAYYSRHKVCGMHSKSPSVLVAGLNQRFCQQCSRFHQLPEFDQGKRSCRRRLAGHNERRRKPQPSSSLASRFARLSSPIFDNNGRDGGDFQMEFASYPKLSLRNASPTPRSSEQIPGNQTASFTWQANSETQCDYFLQGSVGGTNFPGPKHPPVESYNEVTNSSCALSLLSNQTWGSRNTTPSVELNNLVNFNGYFMTQLAASSQGAAIHQLPTASWYLKGIDSGNCSPEAVPDLGLGQHSQPLPGELDDVSQGRRHYMELGQSRASEYPHWSLSNSSLLSYMKQ